MVPPSGGNSDWTRGGSAPAEVPSFSDADMLIALNGKPAQSLRPLDEKVHRTPASADSFGVIRIAVPPSSIAAVKTALTWFARRSKAEVATDRAFTGLGSKT